MNGLENGTQKTAGIYVLTKVLVIMIIIMWHKSVLGRAESKTRKQGFPGGTVVKNQPANAGDMGSSPGPGRSHMPRSN